MRTLITAAAALAAWVCICAAALSDAGVPYQCDTDTQCELLHGADFYDCDDTCAAFERGLDT